MPVTTPKAVKTALAAQITTRTGLTTTRNMPNIVTPPMAAILPGGPYAKFGITFGEGTAHLPVQVLAPTEMNVVVAIFVQRTDLPDAQDQVDDYMIAVANAIFWDGTLGGAAEWATPINIIAYGDINVNDQTFFHTKIAVNISLEQDMSVT